MARAPGRIPLPNLTRHLLQCTRVAHTHLALARLLLYCLEGDEGWGWVYYVNSVFHYGLGGFSLLRQWYLWRLDTLIRRPLSFCPYYENKLALNTLKMSRGRNTASELLSLETDSHYWLYVGEV